MVNLKSKLSWTNKIDKLMFVFASLYLITTLGWLWKQQQQSQMSANTIVTEENITTSTDIASDNNQASELQPLIPLPTIDETSNNTLIDLAKISQTTNATPINLPPPLPPQPTTNIVENLSPVEIIIEEKPPAKTTKKVSSPIAKTTSSTSPQKVKKEVSPKTVSAPKKLAQVPTIDSLQSSIQQESKVQQQSTVNTTSESKTETITTNNFKQLDYQYSLVGVVQLPEAENFALFKINSLTEKISVGAEIGTSGWVLMGVNGTQATISRQNKSLNIRVGETF